MGNLSNARQFYKTACEGGLSKSCNNLGFQLEKLQHWDEALDFYARACLEKHETGCDNLKRLRDQRLKLR
jgi:TPR repeat protein